MKLKQIRQGDVQLQQVAKLPDGCTEVLTDNGRRIVLAYGEATGHAHAISDHIDHSQPADEITENAIARAQAKARLLVAPNGERYLDVTRTVTLRHEEHDAHILAPGVYRLPRQMEYTPAALHRVQD